MKITSLILPAIAIGAASLLVLPQETSAFSTIGGNLGLGQRDFRVFNNFTDNGANNNQTPHANWPGWQGADMAIWKACVEWSSQPHGDGTGDGHQNTVGSGGANYDPSWQGNSNGVGGTNDNIHSELPGCNGGVLAFTETPISNGWRIRYYECWTWVDGPDPPGGGVDLQAIACHEQGHALGLGHSGDGAATMRPGCAPPCTNQRSINSDDKAGVQFIYGVTAGTKPTITSVGISGNQVTVNGSNFSLTSNDVWFTNSSVTANGADPRIRALNVASNGTQITVSLPANAGSGDVIVKNDDLSGGEGLSNPYPFDSGGAVGCPPVANYCSSSINSTGLEAIISTTGTQLISNNDFGLRADDCPANKSGIFYFGPNQIQQVFGEGFRCVGGATTRLPQNMTDGLGVATEALDLNGLGILSGQTHNFQFWYRDPMGGPAGYNLTDAVEVVFCD